MPFCHIPFCHIRVTGKFVAIHVKRRKLTMKDMNKQDYEALNTYANNLNKQAGAGKLDPVIGRDKLDPVIGRDEEIRRVLQILSRRTKNNPILVGEPGVSWRTGSRKNGNCRRHCTENCTR